MHVYTSSNSGTSTHSVLRSIHLHTVLAFTTKTCFDAFLLFQSIEYYVVFCRFVWYFLQLLFCCGSVYVLRQSWIFHKGFYFIKSLELYTFCKFIVMWDKYYWESWTKFSALCRTAASQKQYIGFCALPAINWHARINSHHRSHAHSINSISNELRSNFEKCFLYLELSF